VSVRQASRPSLPKGSRKAVGRRLATEMDAIGVFPDAGAVPL
jgi:hypothetical protein